MILNLFFARPDHTLGDVKELRRVLAELPKNDPFKAVDELYGWLQTLRAPTGFRANHLFEVVSELDEAAQPPIRRLTRDYLHSPRLSKSEERRLWSICYNYWGEVSGLYGDCLGLASKNPKDRGGEALKKLLPLVATRWLAARAVQLKWLAFRYGPIGEDMWRGLGQAYLTADAAGYAEKPVALYPRQKALTSAAQQYLHALIFHSSSMDSLLPLEIELADRLITHLRSRFVFSRACQPDSVYWCDPGNGLPPIRLAKQPDQLLPDLRFFSAGGAYSLLDEWQRSAERGSIPAELDLDGNYPAKTVLPVLRHLAEYWAAEPPQREHPRHAVKTRLSVLQGFDDCFTVFAGEIARLGKERAAEIWVVEDVSLGGFRARVEALDVELNIGTLLGIQPEGGENWVLGVVRRVNKTPNAHANVGIQMLSRSAQSVELFPRASGLAASGAIPGIWLKGESPSGEIRLALPGGSFNVRENVEFANDKKRCWLAPVELEESGRGFEVCRYREQKAGN